MAGAEKSVLRLCQMDPGFEIVDLSCAVGVCMALRRSELMDGGAMDGLIAWEKHVVAGQPLEFLRTCFIRVRWMCGVIVSVFCPSVFCGLNFYIVLLNSCPIRWYKNAICITLSLVSFRYYLLYIKIMT